MSFTFSSSPKPGLRHSPRFATVVLAALAILSIAHRPALAAENPLAMAAADAEFLVSINVRQVADSPITDKILQDQKGGQIKAGIQVIQNLTGVDLFKDLDRICLWGRIDDNDSVAIAVQGRFSAEKIIPLLKLNPEYKTSEIKGITIHEWFDKGEKRMKYGAFLSDGLVMLVNKRERLENAIELRAGAGAASGFLASPNAKLIPANSDQLAAWLFIMRPNRALPNGKMKDTLQAESALVTATLEPEAISLQARIDVASDEAAQEWLNLLQGVAAIGRLQHDNALVQRLAAGARVSRVEGSKSVAFGLKVPTQDVMEIIQKDKAKAAAAPDAPSAPSDPSAPAAPPAPPAPRVKKK